MDPTVPQHLVPALREAFEAARGVRTREDLGHALDRVARLIAGVLGYRTVAVNVYRPQWYDFEATTIHGPEDVRAALLGTSQPWAQWSDHLTPRYERRGAHHVIAGGGPQAHDAPWHPGDLLLVALRGTDGDVLGILSVDGPSAGLRPSDAQIDGLVALAGMAALALGQAQEARRAAAQRVTLDRLVQVSSRVAGERPAGDALAQVCAGISDALGFARVAVLLGDDGAALRPVAAAGWALDDPALDLGHTLADLAPLMGYEHERHGCYLVGHEEAGWLLSREHTAYRSQNNGRGPRAWDRHCLLAPLGTRARRTRGVIWVEDPADRLLPGRDALQGLRLFADLAASVLETSHASDVAGHAAAHDPLTGLANRSTFADRLRHAVQRTKRTPGAIAVLFIDLDRFKDLNDSLGHTAGDELLRVVASRIDADLRPGDTVARFGGDEFVALCEDVAGPEAAFDVAERVRSAVAQPITLAAGDVTITASIGIALPDRPDRTAEAILQAADRAMYEAKAAGRDSARLASPGAGWP